jgi:phenylacetate-CoA ligase
MVYPWQLEEIKEVFPHARIFAHYGCAERSILAGWCESEPTYHVLPQYSLVEVDQDSSEILGTNLYNYVNAFIRYRMTDTVLDYSWEQCPECHRPYVPRLKEIGGRTEDFLFSRQRGWIPPAIITFPFKGLKGIRETQIFQTKPEELSIHFIADKNIPASVIDTDSQTIAAGMQRLFGTDITCRFVEVEQIPRSKSGKFKWVVSELTQPH